MAKSSQIQMEQEHKLALEKALKDKEDEQIRHMVHAFYADQRAYLLGHPDYEVGKEAQLLPLQATRELDAKHEEKYVKLTSSSKKEEEAAPKKGAENADPNAGKDSKELASLKAQEAS